MPAEPVLLRPGWPDLPGVGAAMSLRQGGVSAGPWAALNLGIAVGDDRAAVLENRARFAATTRARSVWLRQVHGTRVVRLTGSDSAAEEAEPADGAWTSEPGLACTVLVADCLPVLFALKSGRGVAAAHAGWRGLAAGVLEATLDALCAGCEAAPGDVQAWLGPCIGNRRFEVGVDVVGAFRSGRAADGARLVGGYPASPATQVGGPNASRFVRADRADGSVRWLADLRALAADRLFAAGVGRVDQDASCTVEDGSRFFSFRRDGVTGRMAAAVWLDR